MDTQKSNEISEGRGASSKSGERPALGYHPEGILDGTESEGAGFFGTCETTLTDWIQLVQMGRRDAVVRVETQDGKDGTLWFRTGDIVDAACDGLLGEAAVYRALSWQSGKVSIVFGPFQRRRQIKTPTAGLLLGAAYKKDSESKDSESESQTPTILAGLPAWRKQRRPTALLLVVAGGITALVLLFSLLSTWRFSDHPKITETPKLRTFQKPVPAIIQQRVTLPRNEGVVAAREPAAAQVQPVPMLAVTRPTKSRSARRRVVTTQAKLSGATSPNPVSTPSRPRESAQPKVNVQIIEDRPPPRIQIIDGRKPRVEVIE